MVNPSSWTMKAMETPDLCFAGEVIDVTERLGGYNLYWASRASGHVAGRFV